MRGRDDYYTSTSEDAGRWEAAYGEADYDDDRPTREEAERDEREIEQARRRRERGE
jgi:hypothetical protein